MGLGLHEWYFAVHDSATGQDYSGKDATGWLMVCNAGLATSPVIYTDKDGGSTLTAVNTVAVVPIANGYAHFWTALTVTSIDVSFLTSTGECGVRRGCVPKGTHMLRVDTDYYGAQRLWIPFAFLASSAAVDTTLDLPANLLLSDAGIRVKTQESADTVDFGFINAVESGDEDGLLDGMLATTAGDISPYPIITLGTNADHYLDTNGKYGVLLATIGVGADTSVTTLGGYTRLVYRTNGTIKSLSYTPSSSSAMNGFLWLEYNKALG